MPPSVSRGGVVIFSARGVNSLFCRDRADRIVINRDDPVLDASQGHEDLARALGM